MRGVYIANLVAQCAIVVTGAVVRLTGSGLGCPTWPECVEGSYAPTARQPQAWHKYVEFGNRLLTFVGVLAWVLVAVSGAVVLLGVIVTGSGPYSGDAASENRYSFDPRTVSWLHADLVLLFLGLLVGLLVALSLVSSPRAARTWAWLLFAVALAQGILGYTQYFAGEPVPLVVIHVLGATATWAIVLFVPASLRSRGEAQAPPA